MILLFRLVSCQERVTWMILSEYKTIKNTITFINISKDTGILINIKNPFPQSPDKIKSHTKSLIRKWAISILSDYVSEIKNRRDWLLFIFKEPVQNSKLKVALDSCGLFSRYWRNDKERRLDYNDFTDLVSKIKRIQAVLEDVK